MEEVEAAASPCLLLLHRHFLLLIQGGESKPARQAVWLMSRHSSGTPLPADAENHRIQLSAAKDIILTRLSMADDVVGIDVAVAQAAQTLQQVQHRQAALYNRMGPSTILATQTRWATTKVEQCLAQSWPLASLTSILRDQDSKRWRSASFVCEVC